MSTALNVGDKAPEFSLQNGQGETVKLKDFRGQPVILYFYPKDNTSGCTKQACDFRDTQPAIKKAGAVVLGVSPDSVASHEKFATKFELPFTLLSDPEHAVAEKYGVWVEKSMYGRKYMGINRTTFLIDDKGRIAQIWSKVKVPGHVEAVVKSLS
ncbi:Putative peroxiredoxin bcp [Caulifigura coniformis]|uniref:thioredoxin-dependent peroxiredoxin n=1 Tax=Caulifigura coniformis TaxID=2527983 RepID=A0A517SDV1_9PLAN|nr:thioredoxin-dependent thiol peroxidase [Caulifigura coniformis]QDT54305.1 Putative peroxiredoxin bcp [Caulifigura coniformis]